MIFTVSPLSSISLAFHSFLRYSSHDHSNKHLRLYFPCSCMLQARRTLSSTPWVQPTKYLWRCICVFQLLGTVLGAVCFSFPSVLPLVHDKVTLRRRHLCRCTTGSCPSIQPCCRILLSCGKFCPVTLHDCTGIRPQLVNAQFPSRGGSIAQRC